MTTDLLTIYNEVPDSDMRRELLGKLGNPWYLVARKEQIVPAQVGQHLFQGGRGWGKSRAASEWVIDMAHRYPGTRLALVGFTEAYARSTMINGDSGVRALSVRYGKDVPSYHLGSGMLSWANGSAAFVRGLDSTDDLRGYNHQFGWMDLGDVDLRSVDGLIEERWSSLALGSTRGLNPQIVVTCGSQGNWLTDLFDQKIADGNPYWTKADKSSI